MSRRISQQQSAERVSRMRPATAPMPKAVPHWQLRQHRVLVITGVVAAVIVGTWPAWSGHRGALELVAANHRERPEPKARERSANQRPSAPAIPLH
jgi:hypothetical protein